MTKQELESEVVKQDLIIKELEEKVSQVLKELEKAEKTISIYKKNENDIDELKIQNQSVVQKLFDKEKKDDEKIKEHEDKYKHLEKVLDDKNKVYQELEKTFNSLAGLFEEYIRTADDNFEIFKVFLRNSERNKELITNKIKSFNAHKGGTEE